MVRIASPNRRVMTTNQKLRPQWCKSTASQDNELNANLN